MNELQTRVAESFAQSGDLSRHIPNFKSRQSQLDLAQKVSLAIAENSALVAEAGTGTGKTFAYLVPALLSGKRVLVSTATKNLQDQLFQKDLPLVRDALGIPVSVALLKGRQNYVCHFHLERALLDGRLGSKQDVHYLQVIKQFKEQTRSGDKSECQGVPESAGVWSLVTSNRDNCLGGECPHSDVCFVNQARKEALEAEVVVINHHLFLADVALKEEGVAELLPAADVVVFDEAHQLPEIATMLLGQAISTAQCQEFLRDLLIEGRTSGSDAGDWDAVLRPLESLLKEIRLAVGAELDAARLSMLQFEALANCRSLCIEFGQKLEGLLDALEPLAPRSEAWLKLSGRAGELCLQWQQWFGSVSTQSDQPAKSVRWVNVTAHNVQFCESPLDVSEAFAALYAEQAKSWIFTSATLSVKNDLAHFSKRLGVEQADTVLLPSPFDYETQGLLCVPEALPLPSAPRFSESLCETLWPLFLQSDGGVFFLCTSLRAVQYVGQYLRNRIESDSKDWTLLVQGEASRAELLERFKVAEKPFLVGAASFWEGVDIRGDGLRLVVIDKLPFAPPDDPVFQARSEVIKKQGGNPFTELSIPDAAIALKQGAGRLIRDETDWGVLVIGDRRLIEKPYGQKLWRSLPPFSRTKELSRAVEFMRGRKNGL